MKKKSKKKVVKSRRPDEKKRGIGTPTRASGKASIPLTPLSDRVVVQITERQEMTAGGIYIPDTAREEKPEQGTVVAVGPGRWDEDGEKRIPVSVQPGDTILFSKYGPEEITVNMVKYLVIREDSILAIIK